MMKIDHGCFFMDGSCLVSAFQPHKSLLVSDFRVTVVHLLCGDLNVAPKCVVGRGEDLVSAHLLCFECYIYDDMFIDLSIWQGVIFHGRDIHC